MDTPGANATSRVSVLEWGAASRPYPGEQESGDQCLVQGYPGGVLVAVVDGLGHGPEAAVAAALAIATMRACAAEPVVAIVRRCHTELAGTRGVVMTLAAFDEAAGTMTWTGVGNVEAMLLGVDARGGPRREVVLSRGGVVGYQLPPLAASVVVLRPGDTLVLATDGIGDDLAAYIALHEPPAEIARRLLMYAATGRDDALALVARYVGAAA